MHDGGGAAAASAAAEAAPAGDSAGIALDAVRDVGGGLGWGCTQALPQRSSSQPDTPDAPVPVGVRLCYTHVVVALPKLVSNGGTALIATRAYTLNRT